MSENFNWGNRRYNAYSDYFKKKYGINYRKVAVDAGFSCPNRDGTIGTGGCTFCNNKAFSPSYCDSEIEISKQIEEGLQFNAHKYPANTFNIAYFQSYTNTYGNSEQLIRMYEEALSFPGIRGISISTRPDAISDDLLDYFENLAKDNYLCVELGIESCFDETLERLNRGHSFDQSVNMVEKLSRRKIITCGHIILGLPGETPEMIHFEARVLSNMALDIIKIHQLQIFKGTVIAEQYEKSPHRYKILSMNEYINLVIEFIERLSPHICLERLVSEVPPAYLAVRPWNNTPAEKVVEMIHSKMIELNKWQGRLFQ